MDAPCEDGWDPKTELCSAWASFSPTVQAYARRTAIWVIWAAAGRVHGPCPRTVRPCSANLAPLYQTYPVSFNGGEGYWTLQSAPGGVNLFGPCCGGSCVCTPSQIALPGQPSGVTEVTIDGATLDPSTYTLQGTLLVRYGSTWPGSQNYGAPPGSVGTWSVTYLDGEPVPAILNDAAGLYACEVGRGMTGGQCRLPNRVQQVTRQGVEIQYVDSGDYLSENRTGLAEVDQLIAVINPYGQKRPPQFWSPDMPQYR